MCTGGSYTEMHKGAGMTLSKGVFNDQSTKISQSITVAQTSGMALLTGK